MNPVPLQKGGFGGLNTRATTRTEDWTHDLKGIEAHLEKREKRLLSLFDLYSGRAEKTSQRGKQKDALYRAQKTRALREARFNLLTAMHAIGVCRKAIHRRSISAALFAIYEAGRYEGLAIVAASQPERRIGIRARRQRSTAAKRGGEATGELTALRHAERNRKLIDAAAKYDGSVRYKATMVTPESDLRFRQVYRILLIHCGGKAGKRSLKRDQQQRDLMKPRIQS